MQLKPIFVTRQSQATTKKTNIIVNVSLLCSLVFSLYFTINITATLFLFQLDAEQ